MIGKIAAVVVIIGIVSFGLVKGGEASAEPTVQSFLLAWESGHYQSAAAMTTGQRAVVTTALSGAYRQLDAADLVLQIAGISQHGDRATATFQASVDLGSSGLNWTYHGRFALRDGSSGWQVVWSPSVIVPGLGAGDRLAVVGSMPGRAQLEDESGRSLAVPSLVYAVGVRPGALTDPTATADGLAAVTGLDPAQVYGQIVAAPSTTFLSLLQLQWVLGLALVRIDIVDGLLNCGNFFGVLVRDFSLEFLFECHDQFNRVQRVCTQIVDERGVIGDFFFFDAQLFGHDLLNLLLNCTHRYGVLSGKT